MTNLRAGTGPCGELFSDFLPSVCLSTGQFKAVQLSSIVVALPLIPVLLVMVFSLMKWIREDYGELLAHKVAVLPEDKIKKSA